MKKVQYIPDLIIFATLCSIIDGLLSYFIYDKLKILLVVEQSTYNSLFVHRTVAAIACILASMPVIFLTKKNVNFCIIGIVLYVMSYSIGIAIYSGFYIFLKLLILHLYTMIFSIGVLALLSKAGVTNFEFSDNIAVKLIVRIFYFLLFLLFTYQMVDFCLNLINYFYYGRDMISLVI